MTLDDIKRVFRSGQHAEAIAGAEALLKQRPNDRELKRSCAMMHALTRGYARALALLRELPDPDQDILFNIGNCEIALRQHDDAARTFAAYTERFPDDGEGWIHLATLRPGDDATLKKATLALLAAGRGEDAVGLCRQALKADPDNITAKLGAEWLLGQMVPIWHVPMMNEPERNQAFDDAIRAAVKPGHTVFEIGTGSGLLAMMAARAGARHVHTCETVPLVAKTAARIVERNGFKDRVTVLPQPSHAVQLPAKADILVHEIFSSELLGEHVLPAIEDAKARLLKPGGRVLPAAASIMVALVGGDELTKNLYAGESCGFDLTAFNAIHPRKRPLYREDLSPVLMSDAVEAFRFDFQAQSTFPAEKKRFEIAARQGGLCHGLIQWIRIELGDGIVFENHPSKRRAVSNWQHTVYGFDAPRALHEGAVIAISAGHNRAQPWFEPA